jgi:hypothetical protein
MEDRICDLVAGHLGHFPNWVDESYDWMKLLCIGPYLYNSICFERGRDSDWQKFDCGGYLQGLHWSLIERKMQECIGWSIREALVFGEFFTSSVVWTEDGPWFRADRTFTDEWGLLGTHSNGFNGSPLWHGSHYRGLGDTMPTQIRYVYVLVVLMWLCLSWHQWTFISSPIMCQSDMCWIFSGISQYFGMFPTSCITHALLALKLCLYE